MSTYYTPYYDFQTTLPTSSSSSTAPRRTLDLKLHLCSWARANNPPLVLDLGYTVISIGIVTAAQELARVKAGLAALSKPLYVPHYNLLKSRDLHLLKIMDWDFAEWERNGWDAVVMDLGNRIIVIRSDKGPMPELEVKRKKAVEEREAARARRTAEKRSQSFLDWILATISCVYGIYQSVGDKLLVLIACGILMAWFLEYGTWVWL